MSNQNLPGMTKLWANSGIRFGRNLVVNTLCLHEKFGRFRMPEFVPCSDIPKSFLNRKILE